MSDPAEIVAGRLRHYADRGVLQGLRHEDRRRGGRSCYSFRWLLNNQFTLRVSAAKQSITLEDALPGICYPSFLDREVRRFLVERAGDDLPDHRRIDAENVGLRMVNRNSSASLFFEVRDGDWAQALRTVLGVVNELFAYLQLHHIDYLHREFGLPEE